MTKPTQYYRNNPITEAFCLVHFKPMGELDLKLPGLISAALNEYDGENEQRVDFSFPIIDGIPRPVQNSQIFMYSKDRKNVLSLRADRVGVHRVGNYESWKDELYPRTYRALKAYEQMRKGLEVERVALHYINLINLPADGSSLSEWFTFDVPSNDALPSNISDLNMSLNYHYDDAHMRWVFSQINQAIVEDGYSFQMNFDLVKPLNMSGFDLGGVMDALQDLRERQYEAFESLITDKLREVLR